MVEYAFERRVLADGRVKYCVPGREPDTAETLEHDGLIRRTRKKGGMVVDILVPGNPRVIAWMVGQNEFFRSLGKPDVFPNLPVTVLPMSVN